MADFSWNNSFVFSFQGYALGCLYYKAHYNIYIALLVNLDVAAS